MLLTSTMLNGEKCVYDLPKGIDTLKKMEALIYGYNFNPKHREELYGQPLLLGLNGPMFNGFSELASTGEKVAVIRYEIPSKY